MKQQTTPLDGTPALDVRAIPALPQNWYLVAASQTAKQGKPLAVAVGGQQIVLYRGPSGLVAYAAKCAHMGCHLKHATGDGDAIRCAMHHRRIGLDGRFLRPDGSASDELVQRIYPVQESWGGVFVWLGDDPPAQLPVPTVADDAPVLARYAGDYVCDINWYSLVANGCDMEHLAAVHGRALRRDPVVDTPAKGQFRIAYLTRVIGRGLSDRVVKYLSGDHIRASMTVCNGSLMLVQSQVWKPSFFVLSMCPDGQGGTHVRACVGAFGRSSLLSRLRLWLTARAFISFLAKDFAVMQGLDWHPPAQAHSFGDRASRQLFDYLANLKAAAR